MRQLSGANHLQCSSSVLLVHGMRSQRPVHEGARVVAHLAVLDLTNVVAGAQVTLARQIERELHIKPVLLCGSPGAIDLNPQRLLSIPRTLFRPNSLAPRS